MFFHMYIAPAQGQTIPWGQKFDANRKTLSLSQLVASLKKSLYIFFNVFLHVYSAGAGVDNPFGTKF